MNYKNSDEFNRSLKKNVYISKVKDVNTFIQLINNIHKSMTGKNQLTEFFYKFDRVLTVSLKKISNNIFNFEILLKNIKSNFQMYLEDLYSLLYMFFINIEILEIETVKEEVNYNVSLKIQFDVKEEHNLLIKDTLLRIKHIKKSRRTETHDN